MSRQITIIGGGLAGLSLGIALQKNGVTTTIIEATTYPRHRVCGEFISGVATSTLENLGISKAFDHQATNHTTRWFYRSKPVFKKNLPKPAIGISRHLLDQRLAEIFTQHGGTLKTNSRAKQKDYPDEATIWSTGRQRSTEANWIGLKCHAREFAQHMDTDLQMHFGHRSYIGISKVENQTANICGLFEIRRDLKVSDRTQLLQAYLRASRLEKLADQINTAQVDPDSLLGVSAFTLGRQPEPESPTRLNLGDTYSMIPPFTGNGMTMAFQSAELALTPLKNFTKGTTTWPEAVEKIRHQHALTFTKRVKTAQRLHPLLLNSHSQKLIVTAARLNLVPFNQLFKTTRR